MSKHQIPCRDCGEFVERHDNRKIVVCFKCKSLNKRIPSSKPEKLIGFYYALWQSPSDEWWVVKEWRGIDAQRTKLVLLKAGDKGSATIEAKQRGYRV